MIAEGKVLRKIHVGKLQSQLIFLLNSSVDALSHFDNTDGASNLLKELFERKELATGSGQGNILALHCALRDESLEFAAPQDRAVGRHDDIAGSGLDAMGVLVIFCSPQAHKVGINITINLKIFSVELSGPMGVTSTLVDSKGNVRASIVADIHHHPNDT
eukprot:4499075-Ditylum_brightwellii.AAC.1